MDKLDKRTIILISVTAGVIIGLIAGALSNLVTADFSYGPPLSFWFGVAIAILSGVTLYMEIKRRRTEERKMTRTQIVLISIMIGIIVALFTLVVAEPDVKIRATIISGVSFSVIFYFLINRDQSGYAGKKVEEMKRDQKRRK